MFLQESGRSLPRVTRCCAMWLKEIKLVASVSVKNNFAQLRMAQSFCVTQNSASSSFPCNTNNGVRRGALWPSATAR